jgi:hypothetical protein
VVCCNSWRYSAFTLCGACHLRWQTAYVQLRHSRRIEYIHLDRQKVRAVCNCGTTDVSQLFSTSGALHMPSPSTSSVVGQAYLWLSHVPNSCCGWHPLVQPRSCRALKVRGLARKQSAVYMCPKQRTYSCLLPTSTQARPGATSYQSVGAGACITQVAWWRRKGTPVSHTLHLQEVPALCSAVRLSCNAIQPEQRRWNPSI